MVRQITIKLKEMGRQNKMETFNKKTIDSIKKISNLIEGTDFYLNQFLVSYNYEKNMVFEFNIRAKDTMKKTFFTKETFDNGNYSSTYDKTKQGSNTN